MLQTPHVTAQRPSTSKCFLFEQIFVPHVQICLLAGATIFWENGTPASLQCQLQFNTEKCKSIVPLGTCYFQTWKQISPSKDTLNNPCIICTKMWAGYPLGDAAQMSTMQLQRQAPYRQQATLCKLTATHQSKNQQHHSLKSKVHGL